MYPPATGIHGFFGYSHFNCVLSSFSTKIFSFTNQNSSASQCSHEVWNKIAACHCFSHFCWTVVSRAGKERNPLLLLLLALCARSSHPLATYWQLWESGLHPWQVSCWLDYVASLNKLSENSRTTENSRSNLLLSRACQTNRPSAFACRTHIWTSPHRSTDCNWVSCCGCNQQ